MTRWPCSSNGAGRTALAGRPGAEQDEVIASLLRRLWRPAPAGHRFRPLAEMCRMWADGCEEKAAGEVTSGRADRRLDPGLVRTGMTLLRTLPASAEEEVLLCTDLHAGNVLAATRERWLMIDPKPYVGDPSYDPVQHLLNCGGRLTSDPEGLARGMAERLELDGDRVLLWLFARCVMEPGFVRGGPADHPPVSDMVSPLGGFPPARRCRRGRGQGREELVPGHLGAAFDAPGSGPLGQFRLAQSREVVGRRPGR